MSKIFWSGKVFATFGPQFNGKDAHKILSNCWALASNIAKNQSHATDSVGLCGCSHLGFCDPPRLIWSFFGHWGMSEQTEEPELESQTCTNQSGVVWTEWNIQWADLKRWKGNLNDLHHVPRKKECLGQRQKWWNALLLSSTFVPKQNWTKIGKGLIIPALLNVDGIAPTWFGGCFMRDYTMSWLCGQMYWPCENWNSPPPTCAITVFHCKAWLHSVEEMRKNLSSKLILCWVGHFAIPQNPSTENKETTCPYVVVGVEGDQKPTLSYLFFTNMSIRISKAASEPFQGQRVKHKE